MRRRLLAAISIVALSGCLGVGKAAPANDVQKTIDTYVAAYPFAQVVVGVVDGAATHVYTASGSAAKGKLDERTAFQIGSITKTFTATLLAQMVLAKEVSLDDPIDRYLPAGITVPAFEGKPVTLLALAEQNSGLPPLPSNLGSDDELNPYAAYTPEKLYAFLSGYRPTRAPGEKYEYSNLGFTLLGALLANREHATYASLLTERVLKPLEMRDTVVTGTAASRVRLVPGYTTGGVARPPWDFGTLGAAGAIESDMHDMLRYLRANLAAPAGTLGPSMELAQRPRRPIGLEGVLQIGLAWMTNTRSGITFHNGQTGGYHSFIGFDRSAQRGVVVLANVADFDVDLIGVHVLAPYVAGPQPVAASMQEPSPYAGRYPFQNGFTITVYKVKGKLYVRGTGQSPIEIVRTSGEDFQAQGVDARITFDVNAAGVATGLTLHQNGIDQHADKAP